MREAVPTNPLDLRFVFGGGSQVGRLHATGAGAGHANECNRWAQCNRFCSSVPCTDANAAAVTTCLFWLEEPVLPQRNLRHKHQSLPLSLQTQNFPAGSILRSAGAGAGKFFASSAIPLAIFTLNKCAAVAPHIHPNAAETLFVLQGETRARCTEHGDASFTECQPARPTAHGLTRSCPCACQCPTPDASPLAAGKIRIHQFRGEEDLNNVRVVDVSANQAGYIQQGERRQQQAARWKHVFLLRVAMAQSGREPQPADVLAALCTRQSLPWPFR